MTTKLRVQDATCGHCKATIEGAVSRVEGVQTADLDLDSKVLSVGHDDTLDPDELARAVSGAGYTPEAVA
jgi:copper chaperone